jgi:hypothetical protein
MICETPQTRQHLFRILLTREISYTSLGMARPAAYPIKKVVGFDPSLWERVRDFRHEQRISTENEAIRRLIDLGLQAAERGAAKDE